MSIPKKITGRLADGIKRHWKGLVIRIIIDKLLPGPIVLIAEIGWWIYKKRLAKVAANNSDNGQPGHY